MKTLTLSAMVLLSIASTTTLFGQLRESPDVSLKGIKALRVTVNYDGPIDEANALSQKQIQAAVELELTSENIRILATDQWNEEPGRPTFYLIVVGKQITTDHTAPRYVFSIASDLIQQVSLARKASIVTEGSTWNQDYSLIVSKEDLRQVTLKVNDCARELAQSIHEANK